MKKIFYKKGERMDVMSVAGEDCQTWSELGLTATVFERENDYFVPIVESDNPGSGNFDKFLELLKKEAGNKKITFNTVVNEGLKKHLIKAGISYN